MRHRVDDKMDKFISKNDLLMDNALNRMARDIRQVALSTVPYKDGDLFNSAEDTKKAKLKYWVIFNTEYAAYQERGQRKDGSRIVRRYTTPGTGRDYLKNGGRQIAKDSLNYFKQAAQLSRFI